jgi:CBS domain-containing protein
MFVRETMTKEVCACNPRDSLNEAARMMWEGDCGAVPVIDDGYTVVGMITDRDICMSAYTQGKTLASIPVSVAMAHQVLFCRPDDTVAQAEEIMRSAKIRRLPVVNELRQLVGILSLNDIARAVEQRHVGEPKPDDVAQTLAAICTPREHGLPGHAEA